MSTFENWLAQYRASVKEACYFLQEASAMGSMTYPELVQAQTKKSTILVIEDNVDEWFLIRWTLVQQFPTAEIIWFSDATQTIDYLETCAWSEQSLPVLILLDLYLPTAQTGLSLLQSIKDYDYCQHIPVVMISRSSDSEDITQAFSYASNAFLTKPDDYLDWRDAFTLLNQYWQSSSAIL